MERKSIAKPRSRNGWRDVPLKTMSGNKSQWIIFLNICYLDNYVIIVGKQGLLL